MDFSKFNGVELLAVYSDLLKEMRKQGIIRTNNVVGDIGEFFVVDYYNREETLPNLTMSKTNTSNFDATCPETQNRYTIKCTTNNLTSSFHGVVDLNQAAVFDYLVILQLNKDFKPYRLIELPWVVFKDYAKMHKTKKAYDISVTEKLLKDSRVKSFKL